MIEIKELTVSIEGRQILKGLNLSIEKGKTYAIMGPNGAGKSTLSRVLAGDPSYEIESGQIFFEKEDLLVMTPEERACKGLFMSFQYPPEIPGVSNRQFLYACLNAQKKARHEEPMKEEEFSLFLDDLLKTLEMRSEFVDRNLNEGFSGGEKKRNEILQMALFKPSFAVLDETDSGLDIDALKIVASGINRMKDPNRSFLLITHYQRLLDLVIPDVVLVLVDGKIVRTGTKELALELEQSGYVN